MSRKVASHGADFRKKSVIPGRVLPDRFLWTIIFLIVLVALCGVVLLFRSVSDDQVGQAASSAAGLSVSITAPAFDGGSYSSGSTLGYTGQISYSGSSQLTVSWYIDRMGDGLERALLKQSVQSAGTSSGSVLLSGSVVNIAGSMISLDSPDTIYNLVLSVSDGVNTVESVRTFMITSASFTCSDGIQNQGETGVDCGGPCPVCAAGDAVCGNGKIDAGERVSTCPSDVNYLTTRAARAPSDQGIIYYVKTGGNDALDGMSPTTAWKTIGKANTDLQPGDTVIISDGIYYGNQNTINPKNSGSQGRQITYLAENIGGVIINTTNGNYAFNLTGKNYVVVSGINIRSSRYVDLKSSNNIIVENGEFTGSRSHPTIVFYHTSYSTLKNNKIIGTDLQYQDLVEIRGRSHHNLIENNRFEQAFHLIIHMYGAKNNPRDEAPRYNIIKNNYFINDYHTCAGSIEGADYNLYEGNFFEQCGMGVVNYPSDPRPVSDPAGDHGFAFQTPQAFGIWRFNTVLKSGSNSSISTFEGASSYYGDITDGTYHTPKNGSIYHNVFYNNFGHTFTLGLHIRSDYRSFGLEYGDNIFKNNILYNNMRNVNTNMSIEYIRFYPINSTVIPPMPSGDMWAGNIIEDTGMKAIKHISTSYTLQEAEQTNSGIAQYIKFSDNKAGNPGLKNPAAFDFSLLSNSIAKDGGVCLTTVKVSGSGNSVSVLDARHFIDGWGIVDGDKIQVGEDVVSVTAVNYNTDVLTVNKTITYVAGECVSFPYSGLKPDIGAMEYTSSSVNNLTSVKAFPGAEGFGSDTRGAYALYEKTKNPNDLPIVYRVTSLEDREESGTLRYGLKNLAVPRIIVFDVGGTITLDKDIHVWNPYITVAGQTAPGEGILLRRGGIRLHTNDVIVRGLRIAPGDDFSKGSSPHDRDAFGISNDGIYKAYNIIVDHCTFRWGIDETAGIFLNVSNVTYQYNLISEGLNANVHPEGPHGKGFLTYGGNQFISIHHNIFAFNKDRNPLVGGFTIDKKPGVTRNIEVINNYLYRVGVGTKINSDAHFIGNYHDSTNREVRWTLDQYIPPGSDQLFNLMDNVTLYVQDNLGPNRTSESLPEWDIVRFNPSGPKPKQAFSYLFTPSGITTHKARDIKNILISPQGAGAIIPSRDISDTRVINQILAGTGTSIDCVGPDPLIYPTGNVTSATSNSVTLTVPVLFEESSSGIGYAGKTLEITQGKGQGQSRTIYQYDVYNNIATFSISWDELPDSASKYRIITDCTLNAGGWKLLPTINRASDFDSDGDGMPNAWEIAQGLNPQSFNPHGNDLNPNYNNIEVYINSYYTNYQPPIETCTDGKQNQGETGVDCGGPCPSCISVSSISFSNGSSFNIGSRLNFSGFVNVSNSSVLNITWLIDRIGDGNAAAIVSSSLRSGGVVNGSLLMSGSLINPSGEVVNLSFNNSNYSLILRASDKFTSAERTSSFILKDGGSTVSNVPPNVFIVSPVNNTNYAYPSYIIINITANDSDGFISRVEIYADGSLLSNDTSYPYSYVWTNASIGSHTLLARAFDDEQYSSTSASFSIVNTSSVNIGLFTLYEASFSHSGSVSNPYIAIDANVTIVSPSGRIMVLPMFWYEKTDWKFRFSPSEIGTYNYTTRSNNAGLNGKSGSFVAVNSGSRGFITRDPINPYAFKYSRGGNVFMMGDTNWNSMSTVGGKLNYSEFKTYIDLRASQNFNYVRSYIFAFYSNSTTLSHYNDGGRAFEPYHPDNLSTEYFKEVDRRIAYANSKNITMHLLFGGDGTVMTKFFGWDNGKMERWVRYVVARYGAYDVNWEGRAEIHDQGDVQPGYYALGDALGNWVEKYDVHNHLQAMHPGGLGSSNDWVGTAWMDWIMHQGRVLPNDTYHWYNITQDLPYGLPVMNEESYYENSGSGATHTHHLDADKVRKGTWQIMMYGSSGFAYGNTGTYNSRTIQFNGTRFAVSNGTNYMTHIYNFFQGTEYWKLSPDFSVCSSGPCLVNPGREYVVYSENSSQFTVQLPSGTYSARFYNPRTGAFNTATSFEGCASRIFIKPDSNDWVLHLKQTVTGKPCTQNFVVISDPLQGSTIGVRVGGTLTPDGYMPGVGTGHILYDLPEQVVNGYVEFEMKGVNTSVVPPGYDSGFIGMYDGRGIAEPIIYDPNFKHNFFRWNFHWRENRNATKAVLLCAAPTPERLNAPKAVFPLLPDGSGDRDWYEEPMGSTYKFNPNNWYNVKIEWKDKNFRIWINGTLVWSVLSGPYDYAPIDFKIWLGSAPGYADKYLNFIPNMTYRNFKVVKYIANTTNTTQPTCFDRIQNQGETGVDCGGPCPACVTSNSSCLRTFYISNSVGNDSNSGLSLNSPKKTLKELQRLINISQPGDCYFLKRGDVWTERSGAIHPYGTAYSAAVVGLDLTRAVGTLQNPIIIGAYGDGQKPTFDFSNRTVAIQFEGARYLFVENLRLVSTTPVSSPEDLPRVGLFALGGNGGGAHNIVFDGVDVDGLQQGARMQDSSTNITIKNSYIRNSKSLCGLTGGQSNSNGIYASIRNLKLLSNQFYNNGCQDSQMYLTGFNGIVEDNIIHSGMYGLHLVNLVNFTLRNNTIYNTSWAGFTLGDRNSGTLQYTDGVLIENNEIFDSTRGIHLTSEAYPNNIGGTKNVVIRNNIIRDCNSPSDMTWTGAIYADNFVSFKDSQIYNNLLYNCINAIRIRGTVGANNLSILNNIFVNTYYDFGKLVDIENSENLSKMSFNHNLYYFTKGQGIGVGSDMFTLSSFKASYPTQEKNGTSGNPLFYSEIKNFELQAGSPAIDKAMNVGLSFDIKGQYRPFGAGYDIGPYEYTGSVSGTCFDGTQNQDETGVDCGGVCPPCITLGSGTTYYVSSSLGSDGNSGTSMELPLKSIGKVNSLNLTAGDNVLFKHGDVFVDAPLSISKSGNASKRITISSYGRATELPKPIIGYPESNWSSAIIINGNYVTVDGIFVYGSNLKGDSAKYQMGIYIGGVRNTIISNNHITGGLNSRGFGSNSGISVYRNARNTLITGNDISYFYRGISAGRPYQLEVSYNTIHHTYGYKGVSSNGGVGVSSWSDASKFDNKSFSSNYTFWIHHNEVYAYEHSAFGLSAISKYIIEYNNVHDPLDDRLFFGVVQHGTLGKLWDLTYLNDGGSIGGLIRYNYIHDIFIKGEAGKIYARPNSTALDDYAYGRKTLEQVLLEETTAMYNERNGVNYRKDKPLYIGADNDGVTVHGLDSWDTPDSIASGLGYANIWLHNNVFFNTTHRPWVRGGSYYNTTTGLGYCEYNGLDCVSIPFRSDLPSHFYYNTLIDVGLDIKGSNNIFTVHEGIVGVYIKSRSPNFIANNILDYGSKNNKNMITVSEDNTSIFNNLYTNKGGYYNGTADLSNNSAVWFRGSYVKNYPAPRNELFYTNPGFVNEQQMVFVPNIGVDGVYMPNFNLQQSSAAINKAEKVGLDPTGRCIDCYDIRGNARDSSPDIGAFEYTGPINTTICAAGQNRSCPTSVPDGYCSVGMQYCSNNTWGACIPPHQSDPEICGNGVDDNCNGVENEGCEGVCDTDNDGYDEFIWCLGGGPNTDCDDNNPSVNPGALEICANVRDDNCNGEIDENCSYPYVRFITTTQSLTLGRSIDVVVNASDPQGIRKVELYINNSLYSSINGSYSGYSFNWTPLSLGPFLLNAKAYDNQNLSSTSNNITITVIRPNVAPTVAILSPTNNQVFSPTSNVHINVSANDSDGDLAKVLFYIDSSLKSTRTTPPYNYTYVNATLGIHYIGVFAYDTMNASANATISIQVNECTSGQNRNCTVVGQLGLCALGSQTCANGQWGACIGPSPQPEICGNGKDEDCNGADAECSNIPPFVRITYPSNNSRFLLGNTIRVTANATDSDGNITKVEFFVENGLRFTDFQLPYYFDWNLTSKGTFVLKVRATDNRNSSAIDQLLVVVNECAEGTVKSCTTGLPGVCNAGNRSCVSGSWSGQCIGIVPGSNTEICGNSFDEDCDGSLDNGCSLSCDVDGDGFSAGHPWCLLSVDCNDNNASIYPGAPEICGDGVDQDCDGSDIECINAPNIVPASGEYREMVRVEMSAVGEDIIRFTTDGSEPNADSSQYYEPIILQHGKDDRTYNGEIHAEKPFTIALWFNPRIAQENTNNGLLAYVRGNIDWSFQLRYGLREGNLGFIVNSYDAKKGGLIGTARDIIELNSGRPMLPGKWHHVAVMYDMRSISLFIDGLLVDSKETNAIAGAEQILIGDGGWNTLFDGMINDVKIYSDALSKSEIKFLYDSGVFNHVSSMTIKAKAFRGITNTGTVSRYYTILPPLIYDVPICYAFIEEGTNPGYQHIINSNRIYYNPSVQGTYVVKTSIISPLGVSFVEFPDATSSGVIIKNPPFSHSYQLRSVIPLLAKFSVKVVNGIGREGTCEFEAVDDTAAPVGSLISYGANGGQAGPNASIVLFQNIWLNAGSDAGSGIDYSSAVLERGNCNDESCINATNWSTRFAGTISDSFTFKDMGLMRDSCYIYRFSISDNVKNSVVKYTPRTICVVGNRTPRIIISNNLITFNYSNVTYLNYTNASFVGPYGKIRYPVIRLVRDLNITENIKTRHGLWFVNSTDLPELNDEAEITFYGIDYYAPIPYKNGVPCLSSACFNRVYDSSSGTYVMTVSGFSTYTLNGSFCGDDVCDSEESCKTCVKDCGVCKKGGGGGGGGYIRPNATINTTPVIVYNVTNNSGRNVGITNDTVVSKRSKVPFWRYLLEGRDRIGAEPDDDGFDDGQGKDVRKKGLGVFTIVASSLVLILILIVLGTLLSRERPDEYQLYRDYLSKMRERGYSDDMIRVRLKSVGWNDQEVNNLFELDKIKKT